MIRRLFNAASVVSLVLCLFGAYVASANYSIWVEGRVTLDTSKVVHDASDLRGSRNWATLTILSAVVPFVWLSLYVTRAVSQRIEQKRARLGRCAGCGYDLRASTGRCPECGTPIESNIEGTTT